MATRSMSRVRGTSVSQVSKELIRRLRRLKAFHGSYKMKYYFDTLDYVDFTITGKYVGNLNLTIESGPIITLTDIDIRHKYRNRNLGTNIVRSLMRYCKTYKKQLVVSNPVNWGYWSKFEGLVKFT